jgi:predicted Zn finger-like uncharacterized protein
MATIVSCPHCRSSLQVPQELLGKDVRCAGCQKTFRAVTEPAAMPVPPPLPAGDVPEWDKPPAGDEEEYEKPLDEGKGESRKDKPKRRGPRESAKGYYDDLMRYQRRKQQPHRGSLILTFGILSLLGVASFIFGTLAWYWGTQDLNEMYSGKMDMRGEGMTKTGRLLGMIGIGIQCLLILSCCFCGGMGPLLGGLGGRH